MSFCCPNNFYSPSSCASRFFRLNFFEIEEVELECAILSELFSFVIFRFGLGDNGNGLLDALVSGSLLGGL